MDLEFFALQRQNAALGRRLELLEAILERSGIVDAVIGPPGGPKGPAVDPSPIDIGRLVTGGSLGSSVISERLIELLRGGIRPPQPVDPAPVDISRLSKVQLEASLHALAAERARLESIESLVKEQISQLGEG